MEVNVDIISNKFSFLPDHFSDRLMQFLSNFWPNHLPKRMENFRDLYEHHWIIEMSDDGIEEARKYFNEFFKNKKECQLGVIIFQIKKSPHKDEGFWYDDKK